MEGSRKMTRKGKLIFGWILIIYSYIVVGVGLWILSETMETYSDGLRFAFNLVISFPLILTTLTIINLLRRET